MKIECIKEQLENVFGKAEKIAGKNPTLPVLSGLYLNADKNNLSVVATNLDLGINITLPVKVVEGGSVVVPATPVSQLISSLSNEKNITISHKGQVLEIKNSNTKASIKTLPNEDFPIIPEIGGDKEFVWGVKEFVSGVRSVAYASATGSVKPELSSILITHDKDSLVFAATDSFRLAEKRVKTKKLPPFKQILIPQKNALEIIKILDKGDEELSLSVVEQQISLRSQNIYLTSRIIEGNFPDYKQIIPKDITTKVVVLKQDIINSLKTNLIFSDNFNQLTFRVSPKNKKFEIESKNSTVGENINTPDAVLEGEDISININHRYFMDCLQSISVDSISINFSGQAKPVVVQGVGDTSFLYLVMPMNQS
jgi:DNA polymerase-3 subunit beta